MVFTQRITHHIVLHAQTVGHRSVLAAALGADQAAEVVVGVTVAVSAANGGNRFGGAGDAKYVVDGVVAVAGVDELALAVARHYAGQVLALRVVGVAGGRAFAVGLRGDVAVHVVGHVGDKVVREAVLLRGHAVQLSRTVVAVGHGLAVGIDHLVDAVPAVVFHLGHIGAHVGRVQQQGADGLHLLAQLAVEVLGAAAGVIFFNALYL